MHSCASWAVYASDAAEFWLARIDTSDPLWDPEGTSKGLAGRALARFGRRLAIALRFVGGEEWARQCRNRARRCARRHRWSVAEKNDLALHLTAGHQVQRLGRPHERKRRRDVRLEAPLLIPA